MNYLFGDRVSEIEKNIISRDSVRSFQKRRFSIFFLIRDLWAVWCPQTGKSKIKLKLEVIGEILGNFSTPPVHLLKIRIRATFDPPGILKSSFVKKLKIPHWPLIRIFSRWRGDAENRKSFPNTSRLSLMNVFPCGTHHTAPSSWNKKIRGFLAISY